MAELAEPWCLCFFSSRPAAVERISEVKQRCVWFSSGQVSGNKAKTLTLQSTLTLWRTYCNPEVGILAYATNEQIQIL